MKKLKIIHLFIIFLLTFSCSTSMSLKKDVLENFDREYQIGAYLWFQTSGEYRALCYQAYNLAKLKLDRDLENKHNRKRAVVLDLDETVLDNSVAGANEIKNKQGWNQERLNLWVKNKSATAIPGAREFLHYAVSRRVEVIYISNRLQSQKNDTYENLKRLDIPVKMENIYLLDSWSKEKRRQEVLKKYDVVLYFGDNLVDFHKNWDHKTSEERRAAVDAHRNDFGEKFIVLPNPLYGDWENSLPKTKNRTDLLKTNL